jgi:FAD/FMN-containing dehydrogenase
MEQVHEICRKNGAGEIALAQSDAERAVVWKGRKAAFAAMGRISPNYIVQDGVIPADGAASVLSEIDRLSGASGTARGQRLSCRRWQSASLVLYDRRIPGQEEQPPRRFPSAFSAVHRAWRVDHRRARRGRREKNDDGKMFASLTSKRCNACAAPSIPAQDRDGLGFDGDPSRRRKQDGLGAIVFVGTANPGIANRQPANGAAAN